MGGRMETLMEELIETGIDILRFGQSMLSKLMKSPIAWVVAGLFLLSGKNLKLGKILNIKL